jgi:hypothetical protein
MDEWDRKGNTGKPKETGVVVPVRKDKAERDKGKRDPNGD